MLTVDEYKALVATHLAGLSEKEITQLHDFDTIVASYALKTWLARCKHSAADDTVASQQS